MGSKITKGLLFCLRVLLGIPVGAICFVAATCFLLTLAIISLFTFTVCWGLFIPISLVVCILQFVFVGSIDNEGLKEVCKGLFYFSIDPTKEFRKMFRDISEAIDIRRMRKEFEKQERKEREYVDEHIIKINENPS